MKRPILLFAAALVAGSASAQTTTRVSVDSNGAQAGDASHYPSVSADGRYVAFWSSATNLVAGDTNAVDDVFVRDRQLGTTERASVSSAGGEADGLCWYPALSADGRFVVFSSDATNLVPGDTNAAQDVFVHDRQLGTTERVSVGPNGVQLDAATFLSAAISGDGRFVAFSSDAPILNGGVYNGVSDIFVRDRQLGTTTRVSVSSGGASGDNDSYKPAFSPDGRFVAFQSYATTLVTGDGNFALDIFVHDLALGTTERVSVDSNGAEGSADAQYPSISADGRFVSYGSAAQLAASDTNGFYDIYVRDRLLGTTELASAGLGGAVSDGTSLYSSISADGRFVAFQSNATDLVSGDTNFIHDIFLRDRQLLTTERLSISSAGLQSNGASEQPSISADGRFVAFRGAGNNLVAGDTNAATDIFLRDRGVPPPTSFCFGDGSGVACPCGNSGTAGRGCQNSATTGGAILSAAGSNSLANDTLTLTSSGELPSVTSIFLQGDVAITGVSFGDGVRCAGGVLKRLYVHNAAAGAVSAPIAGDLSIHARSAALGDVLSAGSPRYYQTYYRDPVLAFCSSPSGNTWNISSGVTVIWTW